MKIKTFILTFLLMSCPFLFGQHWTDPGNLGFYESMRVTAKITLDGNVQQSSYQVAAFHENTLLDVSNIIAEAVNGNETYHVDMEVPGETTFGNIYFKFFNGTYEYVSLEVPFTDLFGTHANIETIKFKSVAQIGNVVYSTLQDAVNACTTGDNAITLLANVSDDVTIKQVANVNVLINGNNNQYSGTFTIHGNSRYEGAETLTFTNINFVTSEASHYFIDSNSTESDKRYAHNVTVDGCTFTATDAAVNSAAAMRIRQGFNIAINESTFNGLHSALQAYGNKGITVTDITLDGKNGISAGTSSDVTISGSTINATGYGVRADANADVTTEIEIENTNIEAFIPVVVRYASKESNITFENNTFVGTNSDGLLCAIGITEYEENGSLPTTTTGKVIVNTTNYNGVYGNTVAQVQYSDNSVKYFTNINTAVPNSGQTGLEGATITLLSNCEGKGLRFWKNNMTFDLGGKTFTINAATGSSGSETSGFQIRPEVTEATTIQNGTIAVKTGTPVVWMFNNYAKQFNLKNVTVDCANMDWSWGNQVYALVSHKNNNGNTKFENVELINFNTNNGNPYYLENSTSLTAPEGLTSTIDTDNGAVVTYENGTYSAASAVAQVGDKTFSSVAYAIKAAQAGQTITLLKDVTESFTISKSVTIDGAGKNYTGTMTGNAGLTVTIQNVNFVNAGFDKPSAQKSTTGQYIIKNCTFDGESGAYAYPIRAYGANLINVEDCTVKDYQYSFLYIPSATVNVNVKNVTVENCPSYAVYFASGVNNGTIENLTVNNSNNGIVYNNTENRALTLTNCTFVNVGTAINHANGTKNITCTLNGVNDFGGAGLSQYVKIVAEAQIGNKFYGKLQDAIVAAEATEENETIKIAANFSTETTYEVNGNVTLDLNGKTITGKDTSTASFGLININPGANLTINDSNGNGKITLVSTNNRGWNAYSSVISNQRGKFVVNGGTIEHLGGTDMAYAIDNLTNTGAQKAETVVNGGKVISTYRAIRQFANSTTGENILTINGGEVSYVWMQSANAYANLAATHVEGGTVGQIRISGNNAVLDLKVKASCLGENGVWGTMPTGKVLKEVESYYTLVDAIAKIVAADNTTTYYASIQEAVNACTTGDNTITLLADVSDDVTIKQVANVNVVIDGNDKQYSGTFTIHGNARYEGAETLTFTNINFVTSEASHYFIDSNSTESDKRYAHNVTVDGCTFTATDAAVNSAAAMRIRQGFNIAINESTFNGLHSALQAYGNKRITVTDITLNGKNGISAGTSSDVTIYGSTINATGYGVRADGDGAYDMTLAGNTITADLPVVVRKTTGAYNLTVESGSYTASNGNPAVTFTTGDDGTFVAPTTNATAKLAEGITYFGFEAKVNNVYHTTFANAYAAAENGDVLTLLKDFNFDTVVKIEKAIKLDLNNNTVTSTAKKAFEVYANATIKNGTIKGANRCVDTRTAVELILTDVVLEAKNYTSTYGNPQPLTIGGEDDGTKVTLTNVNINAGNAGYGIITFVKTELTATNSEIKGYSALYVKEGSAGSEFVFNNSTLTGSNATNDVAGNSFSTIAIQENSVKVTVNDGTINATGTNYAALSIGYSEQPINENNTVTLDAVINGNILETNCLDKNTVIVRDNYKNVLEGLGYATSEAGTGLVKVEGVAVAMIGTKSYASIKAAITAANTGDIITLLKDVTESFTISKSVTIEGAGKNYTGTMTGNAGLNITIQNVKFVNAGFDKPKAQKSTTGTYTIKNCTFEGNGTYAYPIRVYGANNINVENCKVNNYLYSFLYVVSGTNTVNVKDVTVENCPNYAVYFASGVNNSKIENLTVKNSNNGILYDNTANRELHSIKGCTFVNVTTAINHSKGDKTITCNLNGVNDFGGAASSEYAKYVLAEVNATLAAPAGLSVTTTVDGHVVKYIDNVYKVVPVAKLVKSDNTEEIFGSIQEAINAAGNGETVVVLQDVTLDADDTNTLAGSYNTFLLVENKTITIDLNGHTIIGDVTGIGKTGSIGLVGIFSINGTGHLTLKDEVGSAVVKIENATDTDPVYALISNFDGTNKSALTINGGTYSSNAAQTALIHSAPSEKVVINDGNFYLGNVGTGSNGQPWIFNVNGNNEGNVIVNGGTYNYDINHQYWAFEVNISETLALRNNGNGTWTVVPAEAYVVEQFQDYSRKVGYATLEEAFAVAMEKDFTEVFLVDDVVLENTLTVNAGEEVVLVLNGKTISQEKECTTTYSMFTNNGKLTIEGEGTINFKDLSYGGGDSWATNVITNNGELIVENGTIEHLGTADNNFDTNLPIQNYAGKVTINGGTIKSTQFRSLRDFTAGGEIVINGGKFIGQVWMQGLGNGSSSLTINGGEFEPQANDGSSVFITNGTNVVNVSITGGTFATKIGATVPTKEGVAGCITGGTFTTIAKENTNAALVNENYSFVDNGDDTWTVKPTQKQHLVKGWNWYSSYLNIQGPRGFEKLTTALGANASTIKSQDNGSTDYYDGSWYGGLEEISPSQMYKINASEACELNISEYVVNPEEHIIKLKAAGWSWIGYPSNVGVNINVAFANLQPADGDVIKTQNNGSADYAFGQWWGSLNTMVPGIGYQYRNAAGEVREFTYNIEVTRAATKANVTSDNNHWVPNGTLYPNTMTMTAVVEGAIDENYEIAAFVNGEVRGSARPIYVEPMDAYMFFLTIHGDEVEAMTFKCYDLTTGEEFELSNRINYSNDAHLGSVKDPYTLTRGTLGLEEVSSFNIYPNPTTTDREINLTATCDKVEVFNALGVKVAEYQNVDTLDAFETAGIYVIRVTNNGNVKHCRLVVK